MSYSDDGYEARRERQREYRSDVFYEAWRRGLDPDRAADCADDCYYDSKTPTECVDETARAIRAARERRELEECEQQEPPDDQDATAQVPQ